MQLRVSGDGGKDLREAQGAEVEDEQEHRQQEGEVADTVDDERLLTGVCGRLLAEVEADEQVRGKTDALPAYEEKQEAFCQHQYRHEEHEQVQVSEETPVAIFMGHVSGGVKMNQEADARHDAKHDQREMVDREGEVDLEAGDGNPGAGFNRQRERSAHGGHGDPQPGDDCRGDSREEQRNTRHNSARKPAADGSVDQEAGEGKKRNEPEELGRHDFLVLHQVDLVNVERLPRPEDGDNDRQPDCGFGGSHNHYEEHEDLSGNSVPTVCERYKGEVYSVQHQFNRHEDGDDVAPDQKSCNADREQDCGQYEISGEGHFKVHLLLLLTGQNNRTKDRHKDQNAGDFKRKQQTGEEHLADF